MRSMSRNQLVFQGQYKIHNFLVRLFGLIPLMHCMGLLHLLEVQTVVLEEEEVVLATVALVEALLVQMLLEE